MELWKIQWHGAFTRLNFQVILIKTCDILQSNKIVLQIQSYDCFDNYNNQEKFVDNLVERGLILFIIINILSWVIEYQFLSISSSNDESK